MRKHQSRTEAAFFYGVILIIRRKFVHRVYLGPWEPEATCYHDAIKLNSVCDLRDKVSLRTFTIECFLVGGPCPRLFNKYSKNQHEK